MVNHIVDFKFEVIFATLSMLFYDLTNDILKINWNRLDVTGKIRGIAPASHVSSVAPLKKGLMPLLVSLCMYGYFLSNFFN